jgi:hypothetical protein
MGRSRGGSIRSAPMRAFRRTSLERRFASERVFATTARRPDLAELILAPRRRVELAFTWRWRVELTLTRRWRVELTLTRRRKLALNHRLPEERRERRCELRRRAKVAEYGTRPEPAPCSPILRAPPFPAIVWRAPSLSAVIRRASPFSAAPLWPRRRSDIVQQSNKAQLLTVTLLFGRVFLCLGGDPVSPKLVDLVVDISKLFSVIDSTALSVRDLVGNLLHSLDEIVQSSRRKLHVLDPIPYFRWEIVVPAPEISRAWPQRAVASRRAVAATCRICWMLLCRDQNEAC